MQDLYQIGPKQVKLALCRGPLNFCSPLLETKLTLLKCEPIATKVPDCAAMIAFISPVGSRLRWEGSESSLVSESQVIDCVERQSFNTGRSCQQCSNFSAQTIAFLIDNEYGRRDNNRLTTFDTMSGVKVGCTSFSRTQARLPGRAARGVE